MAADDDDRPTNAVYRAVFDELEQRIRRGVWLPGGKLPSIIRLAGELQVGASSVREALRALQTIGLVRIAHGSGVYVSDAFAANDLPSHFQSGGTGLLLALAETRRILEPELAFLAAERGSDHELYQIMALAQEMASQAHRGHDFAEPDVQFHRMIAIAAHNPILFRMMESVNDLMLESRRITTEEPGMTARAVSYHLLIAEALHARNGSQARLLMLAHMNDSMSGILAAGLKARRE